MFVLTKKLISIFILILSFNIWAEDSSFKKYTYTADMTCEHCANAIKESLFKLRKVKEYKADPKADIVEITFADKDEPLSKEHIKKITYEAGYHLTLKK